MEAPGYWDNTEKSQEGMRELKNLKDESEDYENLRQQYEDIETLIEMGYEESDASLIPEIQGELDAFVNKLESMKIKTLLSGEYDSNNAILKLNAGAGGTESCDWAGMLYRMYTRWAERKGFTVEVLDYLDGDEAGIKSVTFQVNGENAYGYLKSEKGVHRLVRISPFNAQGKRQKAKLYLLEQQKNAEKLSGIRGEVKEIGWGNQIRSYVMQPYTMVKDHRTNAEISNTNAVLDGNLDPFINAYLKWLTIGPEEE